MPSNGRLISSLALTSSWLDVEGNGARAELPSIQSLQSAPQPSIGIELGIVPVDEYRKLLFPFSKFGISENACIESITTSCECIKVSEMRLQASIDQFGNNTERLLAVEHFAEEGRRVSASISLNINKRFLTPFPEHQLNVAVAALRSRKH